jgi:hypothetical protein
MPNIFNTGSIGKVFNEISTGITLPFLPYILNTAKYKAQTGVAAFSSSPFTNTNEITERNGSCCELFVKF